MAKTFKLLHDRENCIGCGACAVIAPDFWEMNDDSKSDIIGGKDRDDKWQEKKITDKDFEINLEAAESCPVEVIHIKDEETGEKVI
jgi:ferredoxin